MEELIEKLKSEIKELSRNSNFVHHKWFAKYHLEIVERISLEILEKYPEADKNLILAIVWMHDYGKIIDFENQYEVTLNEGAKKLIEVGFPEDFSKKVIDYIEIFDKKEENDLNNAPIEVKIVSSADGVSHFIGPFYLFWWHENPDKEIDFLMNNSLKKMSKDLNKKIVLPEAKEIANKRINFFKELYGEVPKKFLK